MQTYGYAMLLEKDFFFFRKCIKNIGISLKAEGTNIKSVTGVNLQFFFNVIKLEKHVILGQSSLTFV